MTPLTKYSWAPGLWPSLTSLQSSPWTVTTHLLLTDEPPYCDPSHLSTGELSLLTIIHHSPKYSQVHGMWTTSHLIIIETILYSPHYSRVHGVHGLWSTTHLIIVEPLDRDPPLDLILPYKDVRHPASERLLGVAVVVDITPSSRVRRIFYSHLENTTTSYEE